MIIANKMNLIQQPSPPQFHASQIPWAAEMVMTVYSKKDTPYNIVFPHCGGCHSEVLLIKQLLLHGYDFDKIILMDRNIKLVPDVFFPELEQALDCKVTIAESYNSLLESLHKIDGRLMLIGFHALPDRIDITKTEGFLNYVEYILELVRAGVQPECFINFNNIKYFSQYSYMAHLPFWEDSRHWKQHDEGCSVAFLNKWEMLLLASQGQVPKQNVIDNHKLIKKSWWRRNCPRLCWLF